jgi:hypothetical protein
MKKLLLLLLFSACFSLYAQVVSYPKTLPEKSWSIILTPSYHFDNDVSIYDESSFAISMGGGYGILSTLDVNARYIYFDNRTDYVGVDLQYLVYESSKSYVSAFAGLHYWDIFGCDLSAVFTYTPQFVWSFAAGLDLDLSFAQEVNPRFWIPLNVGYTLNDLVHLFTEYRIPLTDRSWSIVALGINLLVR